jgi:hypothetical protein
VPYNLKHLGGDILAAWRDLLQNPRSFRVVYVDDLFSDEMMPLKAQNLAWRNYLNERYGVFKREIYQMSRGIINAHLSRLHSR